MSVAAATQPRRRPSWPTVGLVAVLFAYADGFWVTSLQGAVGAIERTQTPFVRWMRDSTVMVVVMVGAVLLALRLADRLRRRLGHGWRLALAGALLVATVGTLASAAELTASAAYDYHLQSRRIDASHGAHDHADTGCSMACEARKATVDAHVRGVGYATLAIVATNLVLVGWAMAVRGGKLWATGGAAAPAEPANLGMTAPLGSALTG